MEDYTMGVDTSSVPPTEQSGVTPEAAVQGTENFQDSAENQGQQEQPQVSPEVQGLIAARQAEAAKRQEIESNYRRSQQELELYKQIAFERQGSGMNRTPDIPTTGVAPQTATSVIPGFEGISEDDLLSVSQARQMAKYVVDSEVGSLKAEVEAIKFQAKVAQSEASWKQNHTDYDEVLTYAEQMWNAYPEYKELIRMSSNPASTAYAIGKLHPSLANKQQSAIASQVVQQINQNTQAPKTLSNVNGIQSNDINMTQKVNNMSWQEINDYFKS